MSIIKQDKKRIVRKILDGESVTESILKLCKYFISNKNIEFEEKFENGEWIAVSTNFENGSIITSGKNEKELEKNIKDAILTSFDVPSVYLEKVGLYKETVKNNEKVKKVIYVIV